MEQHNTPRRAPVAVGRSIHGDSSELNRVGRGRRVPWLPIGLRRFYERMKLELQLQRFGHERARRGPRRTEPASQFSNAQLDTELLYWIPGGSTGEPVD